MISPNDYSYDQLVGQITALNLSERIAMMGTWTVNLDTKERWFSENMFRLFGYTAAPKELTDGLMLQRVHPDDRDRMLAMYERAVDQDEALQIEFRVWQGTEWKQMLAFSQIVTNEKSERVLIGTMRQSGIVEDVKADYEHRVGYLEDVIDNHPELLITMDADLRITLWNKRAQEQFLRYPEMVIGRYVHEVIPQFEDDFALQFLKQVLDKEHPLEIVLKDGDGDGRLRLYLQPVKDSSGVARGLIVTTPPVNR